MNTSASAIPFGLPDTAPETARRFALILARLAALVARRFVRMPHLAGFTMLLWSRLNRAVRRFHRALTRPAKSHLPRVRAARAVVARTPTRALPSGRGWLVRELGWEAAAYMAQLETLLAEVAMQAALARNPTAGRILRPICRMLGVAPMLTPAIIPAAASKPEAPAVVAAPPRAPAMAPAFVGDCDGFSTSA